MEVVDSLSQGRTAAAQCGLFTYKLVPVIFEPPCTYEGLVLGVELDTYMRVYVIENHVVYTRITLFCVKIHSRLSFP